MSNKKIKVELTETEAKHVASVLGHLAGVTQYEGTQVSINSGKKRAAALVKRYTKAWELNRRITKKVSQAMGYEWYAVGVPVGMEKLVTDMNVLMRMGDKRKKD